ncbi:hypothetical protein [Bradyrhizobium sp.]|nr:hypothetical protein [Bradyrhizobium sp.]
MGGYGIGYIVWATLGRDLVEMYEQANNFHRYESLVEHLALWIS